MDLRFRPRPELRATRLSASLLVPLLIMATLLSCSFGGSASGRTPEPTSPSHTASGARSASPTPTLKPGTIAWKVKGAPAGRHVLVDGALVGYVVRSERLVLRALDAADGSLLWEKAASPGQNPPGVSTSVSVTGGWVAYLTPYGPDLDNHYRTRVVVAEARTGHIVSASADYADVQGFPEVCGRRICFSVMDGYKILLYSMAIDDGSVKKIGRFAGREIGDHGLVELRTDYDTPPRLGRIVMGKIAWEVPFSEVFAPKFMPDGGWQWTYDEESKLFVGEVGRYEPDQTTSDPQRESIMVGIDAATGKVRWREVGTTRWCAEVDAATMGGDDEDPVFRCRYAKGSRIDLSQKRTRFHNVRVSLERFEPTTGATLWSVPMAPINGHISDKLNTALRLDHDHVMLAGKSGPMQVDLRSGATSRLPARLQLWCSRTVWSPYLRFYSDSDTPRHTGTVQFPCDTRQKAAKIIRPIPSFVGEHDGAMVYVSQPNAVIAYRQ